ncbi:hypothetical protein [Lactococcus lactis]|uniref:hypothetical protein n=1 Tax=Lactococcus lactis TaxID=1358 RepID=UPI003D0DEE19
MLKEDLKSSLVSISNQKIRNTPIVIYDVKLIDVIVKDFYDAITLLPNSKLYFAMKANSNKDILKYLSTRIDGVDVASSKELELALNFFSAKNLSINGPAFSVEEIRNISKRGMMYDFNSLTQIELVGIKEDSISVRVKIGESRFGIDIFEAKFKKYCTRNTLKIGKIHVHSETKDNLFIHQLEEIFLELDKGRMLKHIKQINLGGGFLELVLNNQLIDFFEKLSKVYKKFDIRVETIIEPGQALIMLSAYLITKIIDVDCINDIQKIVVNTSAYNLFSWSRPVIIANSSKNTNSLKTIVYGETCFEEDIMCEEKIMPEVKVNDFLIFYPIGAYSQSNHNCLHLLDFPEEILINEL